MGLGRSTRLSQGPFPWFTGLGEPLSWLLKAFEGYGTLTLVSHSEFIWNPSIHTVFIALQRLCTLLTSTAGPCLSARLAELCKEASEHNGSRWTTKYERQVNKTLQDYLRSASAKMMLGFFPPSSSVTFFRLLFPAASWISLPTCETNGASVYSLWFGPEVGSLNQLEPLDRIKSRWAINKERTGWMAETRVL